MTHPVGVDRISSCRDDGQSGHAASVERFFVGLYKSSAVLYTVSAPAHLASLEIGNSSYSMSTTASAPAAATGGPSLSGVHQTSQTSYDVNAALYDAARPSYIPSAVDALLSNARITTDSAVLDLACGTGKFTALLHARGLKGLQACEPSTGMCNVFRSVLPSVPIEQAGAYEMPFSDGSFDAVTIAQAFHWFADDRALAEIARVLKPGGRLALIWNLEATGTNALQDTLFALATAHDGDVPQYRKGLWRAALETTKLFKTPYGEWFAEYELAYDEQAVWDRTLSKSFVTALPEDKKEQLKRDMAQAFAQHGESCKKDAQGRFVLPQNVRVVWLEKA